MKNLDMANIFKVLEMFDQQLITVIGDLMLDRYIFGKVERISPEAPVPIVNVTREYSVPGGAANVALNLVKMQAKSILGGIIGTDADGDELIRQLADHKIPTDLIKRIPEKSTIRKVRIIGHNQNLLRIDYEDSTYLEKRYDIEFLEEAITRIQSRYLIISDYAKGSLTPKFLMGIINWAAGKNIKVIVDPKPKHKEYYKNCYLITPNKKEAQEMTGIEITDEESLRQCGMKLMKELGCEVVITLGEEGMAVFGMENGMHKIPTRAREVYDVSGAGDTVVAALTLSLSSGSTLVEAAEIANCAAGIKVSKMGTHPVSQEEIINFLKTVV